MPQTYVDLFQFDDNATLVSSPLFFQLRLLAAVFRRRANLVYAPGPHIMMDNIRSLTKTVLMIGNVVLVRSSGGKVTTAGRALRGSGPIAKALERRIISLSEVYTVRDSASGDAVGAELIVAPDVALGAELQPTTTPRNTIALSFRNDTVILRPALRKLTSAFQSKGFQVVLVSQVRRDDEQHSALAKELDLEAILWEDRSHAEQQSRVEDTYGRARAVVSNRLHGLIFGITSGAIPVEYRTGDSDKIRTTLTPWFGAYPEVNGDHPVEDIDAEAIVSVVQDGLAEFEQKRRHAQAKVNQSLDAVTGELREN